ncbi:MAG: hypothetical protein NTV66_06605 [Methylococcales bacterium]|nr:hypothetical protein [Methylococcales bacterium]
MIRSSNTEKTHRLNAAFNLLAQDYPLSEAAEALSQQFGFSRRQAYRYLQEAQGIDAPVLVASPSIPITIKIPADVVQRLRSHAQISSMTIGEIVAQAVVSFLDKLNAMARGRNFPPSFGIYFLNTNLVRYVFPLTCSTNCSILPMRCSSYIRASMRSTPALAFLLINPQHQNKNPVVNKPNKFRNR